MRRAREQLGLSQAGLAIELEKLGVKVDPTAITRMEKGDRGIRLNEAQAVAEAIGVSMITMLAVDQSPQERAETLTTRLSEIARQLDQARQVAADAMARQAGLAAAHQALSEELDELRGQEAFDV